jgi:RimJ/RimL family protein N-acetyltransferase
MIHLLKNNAYQHIRPLYQKLEVFQPMVSAVLDGIHPGKVWVDNLNDPQTAFLVTFLSGGGAAWCFLAGDPGHLDFNAALNKAIFEEKLVGKDVGMFLLTCSPENWNGQLEIFGNPRQPIPMLRQHYVCREMTFDWQKHQPDGYETILMETGLFEQENLQIPSPVKTTLETWLTIEDQRFQDYGYVVVHQNQIVSWATVDFVNSGAGDLGFETLPDFQRRGLGSMVAAVTLEHGLEMGIETHWTCANDNIGSLRTAEKLGLMHERGYTMYLFALDMSEHLAQLAYSHLSRGEFQQAIDCYEQLFAQKADVPSWAYFDTAQAWASLGEGEKALNYLQMAAKNGWPAVEETTQAPEFQFLHDKPEWQEVIEQIKQNQK